MQQEKHFFVVVKTLDFLFTFDISLSFLSILCQLIKKRTESAPCVFHQWSPMTKGSLNRLIHSEKLLQFAWTVSVEWASFPFVLLIVRVKKKIGKEVTCIAMCGFWSFLWFKWVFVYDDDKNGKSESWKALPLC